MSALTLASPSSASGSRSSSGAFEVAVQPVAREHERVAGDELDDQRVDLDPLVDADGARDRVLLLDLLDLLARELSALDELVVDRVVLGHLLDARRRAIR